MCLNFPKAIPGTIRARAKGTLRGYGVPATIIFSTFFGKSAAISFSLLVLETSEGMDISF